MAVNEYDVGDLVRVTATLTDGDGVATDPTALTIKIKSPANTTTTYVYGTDPEVVKSATGIYYTDVSATAAGEWRYRVESTGTGQAASEHWFEAVASEI